MRIKHYELLEDRLGLKKGDRVQTFTGCDYGCRSDDERATGEGHLTVSPDGNNPFITAPIRILKEIKE